jgi:membrane-associated phospholipid phosphatase
MKTTTNRASLIKIFAFAAIAFGFNCFTYWGTRPITRDFYHYDMTTKFDLATPVVSWTVFIYFASYAFWILNYGLGCFQNEEDATRFYSADLLAKIICFILFIVLPTTNIRPEIVASNFSDEALLYLYSIDSPDNLFPSIHCLTSWFCVIAVRNQKRIPNWYKALSVFIALAICVSTLTTKQHVIYDALMGIFLAEFCYWLVKKSGLVNLYKRLISALVRPFENRFCKN